MRKVRFAAGWLSLVVLSGVAVGCEQKPKFDPNMVTRVENAASRADSAATKAEAAARGAADAAAKAEAAANKASGSFHKGLKK